MRNFLEWLFKIKSITYNDVYMLCKKEKLTYIEFVKLSLLNNYFQVKKPEFKLGE